ncbi:MAG: discoidin domain-containing protein [Candidatus Woesebacteria bacterium]|nr:MAG: discoidin domain-containing protein [Candidatus Woesebacteria bacterium]
MKRIIFGSLFVLLVTIFAYGLTLKMYFWQDDNALVFKIQNIEGPAGNFGRGIYDPGSSYRGVAAINYPVYKLFGINPSGFFLFGILFYFLASLSVYPLIKILTQKRKIAFFGSLIFASGYIGAESVWRIATSLHTLHMIIALNITLTFFVLSFKSKKKRFFYYILALLFYVYTMETGYIRAHGIIFIILGIELLLNFRWFISAVRVIPFVYLYSRWYTNGNLGSWLIIMKQKVIDEGNVDLLFSPLKTLQNIIIPDIFKLSFSLFLISLVIVLIWKRKKLLWLGLIIMLAPVAVPYITNQGQIFESSHRYITTSLTGFALFVPVVFSEIFKKNNFKFFFSCSIVILIHLILLNKQQLDIIKNRSNPTRKFYEQLTSEIKTLPKGSALFFDSRDDGISKSQVGDALAVGSMPSTTSVALHYKIDRYDLYLPENFDEILSLIRAQKITKDHVYTFYYSSTYGLTNTSSETKKNLFNGSQTITFIDPQNINYKFSSPILVSLNVVDRVNISSLKRSETKVNNLKEYFSYIESKNRYYQKVSASSISDWKYQEIRYLVDRDLTTPWSGSRFHWHNEHSESVTLDLGEVRKIGAVKMFHQSKLLVPSEYSYFCSNDNKNWKLLGKFSFIPIENTGVIIDKFDPQFCRFVKDEITKTKADDSPQLLEMEVVDAAYSDLDFTLADNIQKNPFDFVENQSDANLLQEYLTSNGLDSSFCFYTDKSEKPFCQSVKLSINTEKKYTLIVPSNGIVLKKIIIPSPDALKVTIKNVSIKPLKYSELENMNYIHDYQEY